MGRVKTFVVVKHIKLYVFNKFDCDWKSRMCNLSHVPRSEWQLFSPDRGGFSQEGRGFGVLWVKLKTTVYFIFLNLNLITAH